MIIDKEKLTPKAILQFECLSGKDVLEIGCGEGRLSGELNDHANRLVAIDPDRTALAAAQRHLPEVDFRIDSGEDLFFPDKCFDTVLFTLSLHHQRSDRALLEAERVLKDGGVVVVIEPAHPSEINTICNIFQDESQALNDALASIYTSNFTILRRESRYPEWHFDDSDELTDWIFSYYNCRPDPGRIEAIHQTLGHKKDQQPLILQDKLALFVLAKT